MSKADRTRARILAATRQLLEDGGRASMSEIATAAGVTRQLVYFHFSGRGPLLVELARTVDAEVRTPEAQALVDDAPSALEALRAAVALQGHIKPRIHAVATALDRIRWSDPDAAGAWNEREAARLRRCRSLARRLAQEDRLKDNWSSAVAARLIWSSTSLRAWEDLVVGAGWSTAAWIRHTAALLEEALLEPQGPPPAPPGALASPASEAEGRAR